MTSDEREWLQRMQKALATARSWETWAEDLHLPQRRSQLYYDDQLCEAFPTSTSAYHGISAAIDHVNFIGDAFQGNQATRPYAYFPPARAATFAAARTVWMLSPDIRKERQSRGLWMEWDNNRKQRGFTESVRADAPAASEAKDRFLDRLDEHRRLIVAAASSIARPISNRNKPPSDTSIMEVAASWIDRHTPPATFGSGHAAVLLWKQHGAASHSLPWINTGRIEVMTTLADGGVQGRVTASYADIGMAVSSAVLMIDEALNLYDKRSATPGRK